MNFIQSRELCIFTNISVRRLLQRKNSIFKKRQGVLQQWEQQSLSPDGVITCQYVFVSVWTYVICTTEGRADHVSTGSHVTSSHLHCTSLTWVDHVHSTFSSFAWEWGHRVLSLGLIQGDKICEVHSVLRIKTPNNRCMTRKVLRLVCKYNLFFLWCLHSQHLMDSNTKVFNDQICLGLL